MRHRRGTSQETFLTAESTADLTWSWDRETGTANDDRVRAIVADGAAGVYVGGVETVPFVRHYDSEGALVWERTFGDSGVGVGVQGLAVAPDGTLIVVGVMNGTITEGTITAIGPGAFVAAIHD